MSRCAALPRRNNITFGKGLRPAQVFLFFRSPAMKSRLRHCRIALLSLLQTALVIVFGLVPGLFFFSLCLLLVLWHSLSDTLECFAFEKSKARGGGTAPPCQK